MKFSKLVVRLCPAITRHLSANIPAQPPPKKVSHYVNSSNVKLPLQTVLSFFHNSMLSFSWEAFEKWWSLPAIFRRPSKATWTRSWAVCSGYPSLSMAGTKWTPRSLPTIL